MPDSLHLPAWLKPANRVLIFLHNAGLPLGTPYILTVPGRTSGEPRSTPVSIVKIDCNRYVLGSQRVSWVKNLRAADTGLIQRGRKREEVRFSEMKPSERGPVLSAYWHQHSQGRKVAAQIFEVGDGATSDDFVAAAERCAVFRIYPAEQLQSREQPCQTDLRGGGVQP